MNNTPFTPITVRLTGVTFDGCQDNIRKWGCPDIGSYAIIREPDNQYDPNAVRVSLFGMFHVGYLPRELAAQIAPLMDSGRTFLAMFVCRNEYPHYERIGMTVKIVETTDWQ